jgi:hypothetical protein
MFVIRVVPNALSAKHYESSEMSGSEVNPVIERLDDPICHRMKGRPATQTYLHPAFPTRM